MDKEKKVQRVKRDFKSYRLPLVEQLIYRGNVGMWRCGDVETRRALDISKVVTDGGVGSLKPLELGVCILH